MTHLAQDELGLAAARGDLAALRAARAGGANVLGSGDPNQLTTLHWACGGGNADVVLWLLRVCRAEVHASRRNNFFPIHTAAMRGHAPVVRLLLAAGADPDVQTRPEGYAPMHSAAWAGHIETVQVLLTVGADPGLRNHRGETPAQTAGRQGQQAVVQLLTGAERPKAGPRVSEIAWGQIVLEELRNAGVEVLHLESREAVRRYNELVGAGRRVGALIHSTC